MNFCRVAIPAADVVVGPALDLAKPDSIRQVCLMLYVDGVLCQAAD